MFCPLCLALQRALIGFVSMVPTRWSRGSDSRTVVLLECQVRALASGSGGPVAKNLLCEEGTEPHLQAVTPGGRLTFHDQTSRTLRCLSTFTAHVAREWPRFDRPAGSRTSVGPTRRVNERPDVSGGVRMRFAIDSRHCAPAAIRFPLRPEFDASFQHRASLLKASTEPAVSTKAQPIGLLPKRVCDSSFTRWRHHTSSLRPANHADRQVWQLAEPVSPARSPSENPGDHTAGKPRARQFLPMSPTVEAGFPLWSTP